MNKFGWQVRVYHEDVDTMGIVYYGNYLKFYERARTEFLRSLGFEQDDLMHDLNIMFVVKKVEMNYFLPARYNDRLWVTADVSSFRQSSFHFDQKVYREDAEGELLNQATIVVVCVDTKTVRPCPVPGIILKKLRDPG